MSENIKGTPKRGVSIYSYSGVFNVSMTLEDCFKDIYDMGASCVEILSSHIENYPNPTKDWVDNWWKLMEKYNLEPGGYGHWCETNMYKSRNLNEDEALMNLVRDFRLANLLGFKNLRTKITIVDGSVYGDPEPGWQDYVKRALEYAEKYDVRMCTEIHRPTTLTEKHLDQYIDFIEKTGTEYFGFNVDFGTFQTKFPKELEIVPDMADDPNNEMAVFEQERGIKYSKPEDLLHLLKYVYYCHAKFNYVDENFEETTIPYPEVLKVLVDNGWSSYLVSEYEGPKKDDPDYVSDQLRRQHVMMKRALGY